jgi:hypothetical protein
VIPASGRGDHPTIERDDDVRLALRVSRQMRAGKLAREDEVPEAIFIDQGRGFLLFDPSLALPVPPVVRSPSLRYSVRRGVS